MDQDGQQQAVAEAPMTGARSIYAKMAGAVASNSSIALAALIVLTLLVVVFFVMHMGWVNFGAVLGRASRKGKKPDDGEDSETESLIDSINSASQAV